MRIRIISICLTVVFLVLPAAALHAWDYLIYANTYARSHDISLAPITKQAYSVTGLDYPGEWVEYDFVPNEFGTNSALIIVRGTLGIAFSLEMTLTSDLVGDTQTTLLEFTGNGFSG